MGYNTTPKITDEELVPYDALFEQAKKDIVVTESKAGVIKDLAYALETAGYNKLRVSNAIIKKIAIMNPDTGKKYVYDDYIRRVLPQEYKDYTHGKKKITKLKERAQAKEEIIKKKEVTEDTENPADTEQPQTEEVAEKQIEPILKPKPSKEPSTLKKSIDNTIKKAIEIGKEHGYELEDAEIEIEDTEATETIVDVPSIPAPIIDEMQAQINDLSSQLEATVNENQDIRAKFNTEHGQLTELKSDYAKLLDDYNRVTKPYLERIWIQVDTPNPDGSGGKIPTMCEVDIVANPVERRIKIPKDTEKQNFKRHIVFEDKPAHEQEWDRLTKGRRSLDVKTKAPLKPQV